MKIKAIGVILVWAFLGMNLVWAGGFDALAPKSTSYFEPDKPFQDLRNKPNVQDILREPGPSPLAQALISSEIISVGQNVLSIGSGSGEDESLFAKNGIRVLATDNNKELLRVLSKKAQEVNNLSLQFLDAAQKFDSADSIFHVAYLRLVLHYFGNSTQREVLREIYRVLRPGGVVIISLKSKNDPLYQSPDKIEQEDGFFYFPGPLQQFSRNHLSREELNQRLREAGFQVLFLEEHDETLYVDNYDSKLITAICKKPGMGDWVQKGESNIEIFKNNFTTLLELSNSGKEKIVLNEQI